MTYNCCISFAPKLKWSIIHLCVGSLRTGGGGGVIILLILYLVIVIIAELCQHIHWLDTNWENYDDTPKYTKFRTHTWQSCVCVDREYIYWIILANDVWVQAVARYRTTIVDCAPPAVCPLPPAQPDTVRNIVSSVRDVNTKRLTLETSSQTSLTDSGEWVKTSKKYFEPKNISRNSVSAEQLRKQLVSLPLSRYGSQKTVVICVGESW